MGAVPVQLPAEPVNVLPTVGWPLMLGRAVFVGAMADGDADATAAVAPEVAELVPTLVVAVTTTFIVLPTSAVPSA
jgi:hypothetical protein